MSVHRGKVTSSNRGAHKELKGVCRNRLKTGLNRALQRPLKLGCTCAVPTLRLDGADTDLRLAGGLNVMEFVREFDCPLPPRDRRHWIFGHRRNLGQSCVRHGKIAVRLQRLEQRYSVLALGHPVLIAPEGQH